LGAGCILGYLHELDPWAAELPQRAPGVCLDRQHGQLPSVLWIRGLQDARRRGSDRRSAQRAGLAVEQATELGGDLGGVVVSELVVQPRACDVTGGRPGIQGEPRYLRRLVAQDVGAKPARPGAHLTEISAPVVASGALVPKAAGVLRAGEGDVEQ